MKCKKCSNDFSRKLIIDGVQRILWSRTSCYDCVPYMEGRTAKIDHDRNKEIEIDQIQCKICGKIRDLKDGKIGIVSKICNSCMVNTRRFLVIQKLKNLLGAKCSQCEYDKCQSALAFHHLDPKEKKFTLSSAFCRKWDVLEAEARKCILLCANCHIEFHSDSPIREFVMNNPQLVEKPERKPRQKCLGCDKQVRKRERKYCSKECFNKNRPSGV